MFVTSFYRKLRHVPFVEHWRFTVQVFLVFTVYFSTNLELRFFVKRHRNTQVVGKVCFICAYALATSMMSFETRLATLAMETNVAFCAHTSCIFFAHFTSTLGCCKSKEVVYTMEVNHFLGLACVHPVVVQQQHYFLFHSVVEF